MNKNNKHHAIKLSDVILINETEHQDAYLCSSRNLWHDKGLIKTELPVRFRIISPSDSVKFSSGGIFTKNQFKSALNKIKIFDKKNIYIIDLLKEYHGFIDYECNAVPFSFRAKHNTVNFGINYHEVEKFENHITSVMNNKYHNSVNILSRFSTSEAAIENIYQSITIKNPHFLTEKQLVESFSDEKTNLLYKRIPCVDHSAPSIEGIIDFSYFIQNKFNSETDWLHIHCHGGKGRSTSFSLIFDILMRVKNSELHNISFSDLLTVHHKSGGKDLHVSNEDEIWKLKLTEDRYKLLYKIYNVLVTIEEHKLSNSFATALDIFFSLQNNHKTFEEVIARNDIQDQLYDKPALKDALHDWYLQSIVATCDHELFDINKHEL